MPKVYFSDLGIRNKLMNINEIKSEFSKDEINTAVIMLITSMTDILSKNDSDIKEIINQGIITDSMVESSWRLNKKDSEYEHCTCESIRHMQHPMNCINTIAAELYCKEFGARLPTKEEWIYAYQAGKSDTKFWWGNEFDGNRAISDVIGDGKWENYFRNKQILEKGTAPIIGYGLRCNDWGLCDLAGNVWEWTSTPRYDSNRIIKGGSWYYYFTDWYGYEHESSSEPSQTFINIGFRCVKD